MLLAYLLLITALTISAVAIYYSVAGLAAIFAAAFWPIVIMGTTLEIAKLVAASWLKQYWDDIPRLLKWYLTVSVVILMLITSMGIFGFLSKAHTDQSLVSGDIMSKIALYDEKIKTEKENIDVARKAIKQLDEAVDQVMGRSTDERGADKASQIRRSQQRERSALQRDIANAQSNISRLNEERAPIAAEVRKVEAEVGPIKYIAKFIYGDDPDQNILEKAVTWVIIMIIFVFDPLAVLMLLASQWTFARLRQQIHPQYEPDDGALTDQQLSQIQTVAPQPAPELKNPDHVDFEFVGKTEDQIESQLPTAIPDPDPTPAPIKSPVIDTQEDAIYDWDGSSALYSRSYIENLIEKLANQEIRIDNLNQEELNEVNALLQQSQPSTDNTARS